MKTPEQLGQLVYDTVRQHAAPDWPLPPWERLAENIRQGYMAGADAVLVECAADLGRQVADNVTATITARMAPEPGAGQQDTIDLRGLNGEQAAKAHLLKTGHPVENAYAHASDGQVIHTAHCTQCTWRSLAVAIPRNTTTTTEA